MRGRLLVVAALLAHLGCAHGTRVDVDAPGDVSQYRTWSWLHSGHRGRIDAPLTNPAALDYWVSRLVGEGLAERGFAGVDGSPDLRVDYELSLRSRREVVLVPFAAKGLSSHHESPSYWVEGSNQEVRTYHDIELWIGLMEPSGRTVWQARASRSVEGGAPLPLAEVVGEVVERLPAARETDVRIPAPL